MDYEDMSKIACAGNTDPRARVSFVLPVFCYTVLDELQLRLCMPPDVVLDWRTFAVQKKVH
jgi:hypothetical protein